MKQFDKLLVDYVDGLMAKAQRRGYSIYTFRVLAMDFGTVLAIVGGIVGHDNFRTFFFGILWGILCIGERRQAHQYKDYMVNPRLINILNASSLYAREHMVGIISRTLFAVYLVCELPFTFFMSGYQLIGQILFIIAWVCVGFFNYLLTSFFLGPNEFGKDEVPADTELAHQGFGS